ncbi:hypothetical protein [Absidia glauca]|uniref:chitinase n=1 Tax=Absidia glauca TaxID=4829 RepID=A0A163MSC4_ABSGL|nr:hypothetical protein [Absidia glauca]
MQASYFSWTLLFLYVFCITHTQALQLVQYWGQNSASTNHGGKSAQKPLSYYCQDDTQDILVVSFVHQFGTNQDLAFDLSTESDRCKGLIQGTQLLDCPQMEKEIQACQKRGKKVLLSLGGAAGSYGLASAKDGTTWADKLWNTFGGGAGHQSRPFGKAVVDGFDLDIEAGSVEGYTAFVKTMRKHYLKDKAKTYYISGAPQCPFPDAWLGDALDHAWFDFVWVQFYNNYCSPKNSGQFNYDTWEDWAKKKSVNKKVKLFLGIPASPSAAGSGYLPLKDLMKTVSKLKSSSFFGGIMMWDVSQAYSQKPNFAKAVAKLIHGKKGANGSGDNDNNGDDEGKGEEDQGSGDNDDDDDDDDNDNNDDDDNGDDDNGNDNDKPTTPAASKTQTQPQPTPTPTKSKHHHHHSKSKHHTATPSSKPSSSNDDGAR